MAPSVTGTPQSFSFTASGTTVTYTGGGTADSSSVDVLCVNSDNTVTVPGFTAAASAVNNQGAYIFTCDAGTASSATINLGGGISTNTQVCWTRITGTSGVDSGATATAQVNASPGTSTPALTSGALAASTELAMAFAALHNLTAGAPTSPAWSSGYTQQATATIGGTPTGVYGNVAVKVPAGTAAESPSLSWTNSANNRYILFVAFLASAGQSVTPTGLAVPISLGQPSVSQIVGTLEPSGLVVPTVLGTLELTQTLATQTGSWFGLQGILKSAREDLATDRKIGWISCPNDGEPLSTSVNGEKFCPYDGWKPGMPIKGMYR